VSSRSIVPPCFSEAWRSRTTLLAAVRRRAALGHRMVTEEIGIRRATLNGRARRGPNGTAEQDHAAAVAEDVAMIAAIGGGVGAGVIIEAMAAVQRFHPHTTEAPVMRGGAEVEVTTAIGEGQVPGMHWAMTRKSRRLSLLLRI